MRMRDVCPWALLLVSACGGAPPVAGAVAPASGDGVVEQAGVSKSTLVLPQGLHHLTVGAMVCALDQDGALWCYGAPEQGWRDAPTTPGPVDNGPLAWWLRKVPGVPPMASLEVWSGTLGGVCGLELAGGVVCMSRHGGLRRPTTPGGAERVQGDLVRSTSGSWHLVPAFREDGDATWTLPWLDGFPSLIPSQARIGWLGVKPHGSRVIYVGNNGNIYRADLERSFAEHSLLVPSLDGFGDVVAGDLASDLAGCASNRDGAVRCWDAKGGAVGPHAADGRAQDLVLAPFADGSSGYCVATGSETLCQEPRLASPAWTVPFRRARELAAGVHGIASLCALDEGASIACVRGGLIEHAGDPARDGAAANEGPDCVAEEESSQLLCQSAGAAPKAWGLSDVVRLPMRPEDALGDLERELGDADG